MHTVALAAGSTYDALFRFSRDCAKRLAIRRTRGITHLQELLPFIVAGIATGSIYGLAATGLVLSYKTSGIFNFGYGAIATAAAYFFYFLHYRHGVDSKRVLLLSVFIGGP